MRAAVGTDIGLTHAAQYGPPHSVSRVPSHNSAGIASKGSDEAEAAVPRLDRARWPDIAERARYESLRDLAAGYGVSHETVRAIVGRAAPCLAAVGVASASRLSRTFDA